MTLATVLYRRFRWAGLPISLLVTLLQRAPSLPALAATEEIAASPPAAAILRSAVAAAASLGAIQTLAGATSVVASPSTPLSATVGQSVTAVFVVSGSQNPASSWSVSGSIPPGLNFQGLTSPGRVNVESIDGHATLSGMPTAAGTYHMTMIGWEDPNATGASSSSFNYTVVVSANANAPGITTQPQSQTVNVGQSVSLTVAASGSPTYQWQFNSSPLAGATAATYTIASAQLGNAGNYTVTATNASGATTSDTAALTVVNPAAPPVFTTQPVSQTVPIGTNLTLTAMAIGNNPTYQWLENGVKLSDAGNLSGSATSTLAISNAQSSNAGSYSVVATNSAGSTTSGPAILSFNIPPSAPYLLSGGEPNSQTIAPSTTVTFSVVANGVPTPTYQWYFNGNTPLSGATDPTLLLTKATAANAGNYSCIIANSAGTVASLAGALTVASTTNVGRLINLSVNATAGKSQVLTVGFVTGGSGTVGSQNVLIRATGPALAALGVPATLADPTLSVLSGQTVVAANDNWGTPLANQTAVTAADNATGAFALTNPSSLDAALVTSLPTNPGYTVQISGNTAASGITLAEIYDDTPANSYTLTTPRLINISANNLIAANGEMIAGFVVGGTTAKTVLIRATGPALAALGVQGTMPDPQLALHTTIGGQDVILAANTGWGGDPQLTAVSNSVGAFPLTNPTSKDSVLLTTLAPGEYTAVASSVSGTAGIALIEVYEVP